MKIGVILSGCGYLDGSETQEAILTLLALDQAGVAYDGIAPNRDQHHVVDHLNGESTMETRNCMIEATRIMRGNVIEFTDANLEHYDALIVPGGFGVAKQLCDFAIKGKDYHVEDDILTFARDAYQMGKPIGFMCIAPMLMPFIYPEGVKMTIGNDADIAAILQLKGAEHIACDVTDIVVDERYKTVSTPAYMLGQNISDVYTGINKLVQQVIQFAQNA